MHKVISTKVQGKTCYETKLNKVDQTFWFSTFYVFLDFLTQKQEKINKKQLEQMQTNKQFFNSNFQKAHNQT